MTAVTAACGSSTTTEPKAICLQRSFQRSLHPDKENAGRVITNPYAGPLFADEQDGDDLASGTIYVLRSKSDNPIVAANRAVPA